MIDLYKIEYNLTGTWPSYEELEKEPNIVIVEFITKIYKEGVFVEINRLMTSNEYPKCGGIGHIVLISICSAIDSLSAYAAGGGKVGHRFSSFIAKYFPDRYSGKEEKIFKSFRCDSVHGWNLHKSVISGIINDPLHLSDQNGVIYLSLYDFFNDLTKAFEIYCDAIKRDDDIKNNILRMYEEIKC